MNERPMSRREALLCGAGWAGMLGLGAAIAAEPSEDYTPAGRISVRDVGSLRVDHVTLNGEKVMGVFEADDVEGWLRRYAYDHVETTKLGDTDVHRARVPRVERLTGVVHFHWKAGA